MHALLSLRGDDHVASRLSALLERVVADRSLHARFLNTLARLEYVGVRKMLKARRSQDLDLEGLQHILDETVHALRLKKAALSVAESEQSIRTFQDGDTLAGDAAEAYFQAVDHAAEAVLADLGEHELADGRKTHLNYLLTSAAIEIRAQAFYPVFEAHLKSSGAQVTVAPILRDEDRHLEEMSKALANAVPNWEARLGAIMDRETSLFAELLTAFEFAAAKA